MFNKQKKERSSALVVQYNQYKYIAQGFTLLHPPPPWIRHCAVKLLAKCNTL